MEIKNSHKSAVVWVNKAMFHAGTSWTTMHNAGERAHPGYKTRICLPNQIIEGEEAPTAFDGPFYVQDGDVLSVKVSTAELDEFKAAYKITNPVNGQDYGPWHEKRNEAIYSHFRGKFFYENEKYDGCRVSLKLEAKSVCEVK